MTHGNFSFCAGVSSGTRFDIPDPPSLPYTTAGTPKFLFDEDPPPPGGGGDGPLEGNQQIASVFKASQNPDVKRAAAGSAEPAAASVLLPPVEQSLRLPLCTATVHDGAYICATAQAAMSRQPGAAEQPSPPPTPPVDEEPAEQAAEQPAEQTDGADEAFVAPGRQLQHQSQTDQSI